MKRIRHSPEQIIRKLRKADRLLAEDRERSACPACLALGPRADAGQVEASSPREPAGVQRLVSVQRLRLATQKAVPDVVRRLTEMNHMRMN